MSAPCTAPERAAGPEWLGVGVSKGNVDSNGHAVAWTGGHIVERRASGWRVLASAADVGRIGGGAGGVLVTTGTGLFRVHEGGLVDCAALDGGVSGLSRTANVVTVTRDQHERLVEVSPDCSSVVRDIELGGASLVVGVVSAEGRHWVLAGRTVRVVGDSGAQEFDIGTQSLMNQFAVVGAHGYFVTNVGIVRLSAAGERSTIPLPAPTDFVAGVVVAASPRGAIGLVTLEQAHQQRRLWRYESGQWTLLEATLPFDDVADMAFSENDDLLLLSGAGVLRRTADGLEAAVGQASSTRGLRVLGCDRWAFLTEFRDVAGAWVPTGRGTLHFVPRNERQTQNGLAFVHQPSTRGAGALMSTSLRHPEDDFPQLDVWWHRASRPPVRFASLRWGFPDTEPLMASLSCPSPGLGRVRVATQGGGCREGTWRDDSDEPPHLERCGHDERLNDSLLNCDGWTAEPAERPDCTLVAPVTRANGTSVVACFKAPVTGGVTVTQIDTGELLLSVPDGDVPFVEAGAVVVSRADGYQRFILP